MRRRLAALVAVSFSTLSACASREGASGAAPDAGSDAPGGDAVLDASAASDALSVRPPVDDGDTPPSEAGPGGPWLAFASSRGGSFDLYLIHPDGTGLRPLVQDPSTDVSPAWSPDGAKVAFASNRSGAFALYVVDVASGAVRPVPTPSLVEAQTPAYSPDGASLVFAGDGADGGLLYRIAATADAAPVVLTSGTSRDSSPVFAPAGDLVYFASDRSGSFDVWSVGVDGTGARQVTTNASLLGGPALSSDGASLAFARNGAASDGLGAGTQVAIFSFASQSTRVLSALGDSEPAFARSGARVAMTTTRYDPDNADIVLVDPDGSNPFRLTDDPAADGQAAFQPVP